MCFWDWQAGQWGLPSRVRLEQAIHDKCHHTYGSSRQLETQPQSRVGLDQAPKEMSDSTVLLIPSAVLIYRPPSPVTVIQAHRYRVDVRHSQPSPGYPMHFHSLDGLRLNENITTTTTTRTETYMASECVNIDVRALFGRVM